MVERCIDIADTVVRFYYEVPSLEVVTDKALVVGEKVLARQPARLLGHGSVVHTQSVAMLQGRRKVIGWITVTQPSPWARYPLPLMDA